MSDSQNTVLTNLKLGYKEKIALWILYRWAQTRANEVIMANMKDWRFWMKVFLNAGLSAAGAFQLSGSWEAAVGAALANLAGLFQSAPTQK